MEFSIFFIQSRPWKKAGNFEKWLFCDQWSKKSPPSKKFDPRSGQAFRIKFWKLIHSDNCVLKNKINHRSIIWLFFDHWSKKCPYLRDSGTFWNKTSNGTSLFWRFRLVIELDKFCSYFENIHSRKRLRLCRDISALENRVHFAYAGPFLA